jgi:mannosylglycerate hydrolase
VVEQTDVVRGIQASEQEGIALVSSELASAEEKGPVYLMHHTHWDREWYEPFVLYQLRLGHVVGVLLSALDDGNLAGFTLPGFTLDGQTSLLDDAAALLPDMLPRLQTYIANGRLSVGPWFTAPDEWLVSGEALKRNLQRGIQQAKGMGCNDFTGYLPDTFGHSRDMPDILHAVGIDSAIMWRGVPSALSPVFWWQSPTNPQVKVLVYHLQQGYFQHMWHDPELNPAQRQASFTALLSQLQAAQPTAPVLLPLGGDHLGPTPVDHLLKTYPVIQPAPFMQQLMAWANSQPDLPVYTGDLMDNQAAHVLCGVWSARLDLKIRNRMCEHWLIKRLEPAMQWACQQLGGQQLAGQQTTCALSAMPVAIQAGFQEAWRLLLLNHPHDSIGGCSVDPVHADNLARFTAIEHLSKRLLQQVLHVGMGGHGLQQPQVGAAKAHHLLTHWGDTPYTGVVPVCFKQLPDEAPISDAFINDHSPEQAPVQVFQLERSTPDTLLDSYATDLWDVPLSHVRMRQSSGWLWVQDLPPQSVTALSDVVLLPPQAPPPQTVTARQQADFTLSLCNSHLNLTILPDGQWQAINVITGEQQHQVFTLTAQHDEGDSYNAAPTGPVVFGQYQRGEVVMEGPLMARLRLHYTLSDMTMTVTVDLAAGNPWVNVSIEWFNTQPNTLVCAVFRQPQPVTALWVEGHGKTLHERLSPLPHSQPATPLIKGQEWLPPGGALQRFLLTPTQWLATMGLTAYTVSQYDLQIPLHRGFGILSRGDNPTRQAPAGPPFATPDAQLLYETLTRQLAWSFNPSSFNPCSFNPCNEPTAPEAAFTLADNWADNFYGITHGVTVWTRQA